MPNELNEVKRLLDLLFEDSSSSRGLTHDFLVSLLQARNYRVTDKGTCYGFACTLALSNLIGELYITKQRIDFINSQLLMNHIEAYNETLKFFQNEGREFLNTKTSDDDKCTSMGKYYALMQNMLLGREGRRSIEIQAYFDDIAIIQSPREYDALLEKDEQKETNLFSDSQDIALLLPIITPVLLGEQGGAHAFSSIGLSFNEEEFNKFLEAIKNNLIDKLKIPVSFIISANSHAVFFGYDPQSQRWVTGDANGLPESAIDFLKTPQELAKRIICSYQAMSNDKKNSNVCMNIRLLGLKSREKEINVAWNTIQTNLLDSFGVERISKKDGINETALDVSMFNHANEWTISLLTNKQQLKISDLTDDPKILYRALKTDINPIILKQLLSLEGVQDLLKKDGYDLLCFALTHRQNEKLKLLVEAGANIEGNEPEEIPLVFLAKDVQMLETLFKLGANPNAVYKNINLLFTAIEKRDIDTVKLLIGFKVNVNQPLPSGLTSLILAKNNPEIMKLLLEAGADPNRTNREGFTALHYAIKDKNLDACILLIKHGADLNFSYTSDDKKNPTPFELLRASDFQFQKAFVDRLDKLASDTLEKIKNFITTNKNWDVSKIRWEDSYIKIGNEFIKVPKHVKAQWEEITNIEQKNPRKSGEYWAAYQRVISLGRNAATEIKLFRGHSSKKYYELFQTKTISKLTDEIERIPNVSHSKK